MAGFIFYFPGSRDAADPAKLLALHGCAELLAADDELPSVGSLPVAEGPDGGAGLIARWSGPNDPPLAYRFSSQTWRPGPKRANYWFGWDNDAAPTPGDLRRRNQLVGMSVKLGAESWTVPLARELPQALGLDGDGKLVREFDDPRLAEYFDRTTAAMAALGAIGESVVYSIEDQFRFACFALGFNYRVNAELLTAMRAIRSDLVWGAAWAAAGAPDLEDAAKKALPEAAIAVGDSG